MHTQFIAVGADVGDQGRRILGTLYEECHG
jgi:hypothetical protein